MSLSFVEQFQDLPDPRVDRTKLYPLLEIILLVVSATVSGFDGWTSIKRFGDEKLDWLRQFLPYEQGIPVDDTIARVMRKLDTQMFKTCFFEWMKSVSQATDGDVVVIDGKKLALC
jgi:DDE_Tnp_1-associated